MTRRRWIWRAGEFIEITPEVTSSEVPAIHQDSMAPLKHPKTGEIVESRTRWEQINKEHGLQCVGNDLLSNYKRVPPEHVTEARIRDAMEKAESTWRDSAKMRAWRNEQMALNERNARLLNGRR